MIDSADNAARGIRILRLYLQGTTKSYTVDFRHPDGRVRPLSIIAGPVSTGKSSILEFIRYGLGGRDHPQHEEVLAQVTECLVEIALSGEIHVLKRSVGRPSKLASVYAGTLDQVLGGSVIGVNRTITPAGDRNSLSSFILSSLGLEGVKLKEAPTQEESETDPLSIRDLFWLTYMPNERLDDKNLLFESHRMKAIKLRQVINVVFNVHDHRQAELDDRVKAMKSDLGKRKDDLASAANFVREQEPRSETDLQDELDLAENDVAAAAARVGELERSIENATSFASEMRDRHQQAARSANVATNELRDKRTLIKRLSPLRAQYSEDLRKLTMLADAHSLFDPLGVSVCPGCFSSLDPLVLIAGACSLCRTELPNGEDLNLGHAAARRFQKIGTDAGDSVIEQTEHASSDQPSTAASEIVEAHLRSTKARLNELNEYVESLQKQLIVLKRQHDNSVAAEAAAARALDEVTAESITPFLAERDELRRLQHKAQERVDEINRGLRLYKGLREREAHVDRLKNNLTSLHEQRKKLKDLGDEKKAITEAISKRFRSILKDFKYPKLANPYINGHWEPHVRDASYKAASSGARTLLSIAWTLAIFEVAFERGDGHPGFLMLDSPQKNIGGSGDSDDEFTDSAIVDGVYKHFRTWLADEGAGSQILVVDNDPPAWVDADVVVRYTRDAEDPPYGLIDNEVAPTQT